MTTPAVDLLALAKPDAPGIRVSFDSDLDEPTFVSLLTRYAKTSFSPRAQRTFDAVAARNIKEGESPSDAAVDALVQACVTEQLFAALSRPVSG